MRKLKNILALLVIGISALLLCKVLGAQPNYFDRPQFTNLLYAYNVGIWVTANDGNVPPNAVVYGNRLIHNYYCRIYLGNVIFYGVLLPQTGCYVQTFGTSALYQHYEVLVNG